MLWFRFYDAMLNDRTCQQLPPKEFRKRLFAAMNGEQNEFSRFLVRGSDRLPAHEWRPLRERIFARDDFTCGYCGTRGGRLECDHVIPISRGGSNDPNNLVTACFRCNRSKRARLIEEWV